MKHYQTIFFCKSEDLPRITTFQIKEPKAFFKFGLNISERISIFLPELKDLQKLRDDINKAISKVGE